MRSWSRIVIIVLLAIITALVYYPFSEALIHAGLTRVGTEYPILQKVQDIMAFLITTSTSFFESLVWLWWFNSAVKRVRTLFLGVCAWFLFDSIIMSVLEEAVQKHPFSDITRHLHDNTIMDAKIGIAALAVFIVADGIIKKNRNTVLS